MADPSTKPKRKRRWLRYSLRSLLLVMLMLSVWLGWMANRAAKQRRAVALVEELGGVAFYECQKPTTTGGGMGGNQGSFAYIGPNRSGGGMGANVGGGAARRSRYPGGIPTSRSSVGEGSVANFNRQAAPTPLNEPPPEDDDFLHKYVEHDWFHDVVHVRLVGPEVTDEQLGKVVDGLPNIVRLTLRRCSITDAGLEHVASLERLESLSIAGTDVTADGIARLRSQRPTLTILHVSGADNSKRATRINSQGLPKRLEVRFRDLRDDSRDSISGLLDHVLPEEEAESIFTDREIPVRFSDGKWIPD